MRRSSQRASCRKTRAIHAGAATSDERLPAKSHKPAHGGRNALLPLGSAGLYVHPKLHLLQTPRAKWITITASLPYQYKSLCNNSSLLRSDVRTDVRTDVPERTVRRCRAASRAHLTAHPCGQGATWTLASLCVGAQAAWATRHAHCGVGPECGGLHTRSSASVPLAARTRTVTERAIRARYNTDSMAESPPPTTSTSCRQSICCRRKRHVATLKLHAVTPTVHATHRHSCGLGVGRSESRKMSHGRDRATARPAACTASHRTAHTSGYTCRSSMPTTTPNEPP